MRSEHPSSRRLEVAAKRQIEPVAVFTEDERGRPNARTFYGHGPGMLYYVDPDGNPSRRADDLHHVGSVSVRVPTLFDPGLHHGLMVLEILTVSKQVGIPVHELAAYALPQIFIGTPSHSDGTSSPVVPVFARIGQSVARPS